MDVSKNALKSRISSLVSDFGRLKFDESIWCIPRLPQDPKICGIDDAKVVGDLIAEDVPLFRHVLS